MEVDASQSISRDLISAFIRDRVAAELDYLSMMRRISSKNIKYLWKPKKNSVAFPARVYAKYLAFSLESSFCCSAIV